MKNAVKLLTFSKDIRQGDVLLRLIDKMPANVAPADGQERKIILAWGEVTGHHHRIEDHVTIGAGAAAEITEAAIARARLFTTPSGDRFLEVKETVHLTHEEHTAHAIPPGIYQLPIQVEYTAGDVVRQVQD